jgi:hypothetical protein
VSFSKPGLLIGDAKGCAAAADTAATASNNEDTKAVKRKLPSVK